MHRFWWIRRFTSTASVPGTTSVRNSCPISRTGCFSTAASCAWFGLWGNAAFYSFAIIGLYAAIAKLGALKTAMLLNMEPIGTIMLAWLILGQRLSPIQLVGAALVIGSILFVSRPRSVASGAKQG